MPCAIMWTAVHLCRWLWALTISNDWQYSVKKYKWPWRSNTTSWTQSRNGDEGEWPSSHPSPSSEDLTSHRMEGYQPKTVWRGKKTNFNGNQILVFQPKAQLSYRSELPWLPNFTHIKLLLLVLLVLLIGGLLGLT